MSQKRAIKTLKRQPRLKFKREKKLADKITYRKLMKELLEQMKVQEDALANLTPEELEAYLVPKEAEDTNPTEPITEGEPNE